MSMRMEGGSGVLGPVTQLTLRVSQMARITPTGDAKSFDLAPHFVRITQN
jgi:hypothetical protein